MLDKHGKHSQDWELVEGLNEVIMADSRHTVHAMANSARSKAVEQHSILIQNVGVPRHIASKLAARSW
jgi:hypothetical protein